MAQFHQGLSGNGIMSRDVAFNRGIPVNLAATISGTSSPPRHESTALIHIRPAVIPAMQAKRLDALVSPANRNPAKGRPSIASKSPVAAQVAERRSYRLFRTALNFCARGEIRRHERQPEGFAVHRHRHRRSFAFPPPPPIISSGCTTKFVSAYTFSPRSRIYRPLASYRPSSPPGE